MKAIKRFIMWLPNKIILAFRYIWQYRNIRKNNKRLKNIDDKKNEIRKEFNVTERDGSLWLTHNDTAFMKVSSLSPAESVTSELNRVRESAVEFARL